MAPRVVVGPSPTARASAAGKWNWREKSTQFFCLIILLGFPIFSVPCQRGICNSALNVVVTYGYCKNLLSEDWTKYLLYPATLMQKMEVLLSEEPSNFKFPDWDSILSSWNISSDLKENEKTIMTAGFKFPNFLSMYESQGSQNLNWEFTTVSTLCLVGAVLAILGPNRVAFAGIMGIIWYLFVEGGKREDITAQPMLAIAIACSLGWVNFKELFSASRSQEPANPKNQANLESKKQE